MRLGGSLVSGNLGPPVVPFYRFFLGEGSPIKIDYRKRGPLFQPLLEDLVTLTPDEATFIVSRFMV